MIATVFLASGAIAAPSKEASLVQSVTLSKEGTKIEEDGHSVEFGDHGKTKINSQNPDFDRGMEALLADRMREAVDYFGRLLEDTGPQNRKLEQ